MDNQDLYNTLIRLDGKNYKAYKDIKANYQFPKFDLIIEHIQGDPFASPSKLIIKIPHNVAEFPTELYENESRKIALEDYLIRQFSQACQQISRHRGTGKSGKITIIKIGQEILKRTAANINKNDIEIRFSVGLPARGRTILGHQAAQMLCEDVPDIVEQTLLYQALDSQGIKTQVETAEDADFIRQQLSKNNLVTFIANGSILPRKSGIDPRPLETDAIPFKSPESLEIAFETPNQGLIKGLGITQGITLIVGGGYHGKSTLLKAIELGIYNHIPGDGREFVISDPSAVKIRAEDGRSIVGVDISPFINQLPQQRSTNDFTTTNASGSTSQAANIIEALEAGSKVLLVDEDTAANNFMIRDRRMQQLIAKNKEPITPFIDKIKQLYIDYGVSTILVMGGSGDYFDVADQVIAMDNFEPYNVTEKAQKIAQENPNERMIEGGNNFGNITPRIPLAQSIDPSRGRRDVKVKVRDVDQVVFGTEDIDLTSVEQLIEPGQLRSISAAIIYAKQYYMNEQTSLPDILDQVMEDIDSKGLDILSHFPQGDLVIFRRFELAAAINRLRSLKVYQLSQK
ncbi:ABC-ATPase domain-containing protein [Crocosphaera watsonii]|uniref:Isopentenyl-diphosphate delta-isomerase n=1 Tax=Crocosphaera watsonii WH 8502 TaxID=423474 RepID=T2I9X6_CROWT|nr:ABC-ATPase domain-containing protein [Crocosphaera watsonii]CCQ49035.1 Isopentenyl-diphosphate delta-isomerase [Crocosphaera watsonii WH 8502]